ncbi:hypothetical protein JGC56_02775 [Salmonella enterica subsp. enterica serovar Saintpaul]|nr:hypothetical protein [Salmonella enterica subsp. enterica serovar Saintpaul]
MQKICIALICAAISCVALSGCTSDQLKSTQKTERQVLSNKQQSDRQVGNPRPGASEALQQYADALLSVDLTLSEPDWPEIPAFLTRQR